VDRSQKQQAVSDLKEVFDNSNTVVVTHYRGMTVDEMTELRNKARDAGAKIKVTKNKLAKIASNDTDFACLTDFFSGPTAIAYSDDAVAPAKTIVDFAKENEKLVIVGGAIDGISLDEAGVKSLANTPSLDESRGKIVGILTAPASAIVRTIVAPAGQVARVINAHATNG